jgi:hypothetical protein
MFLLRDPYISGGIMASLILFVSLYMSSLTNDIVTVLKRDYTKLVLLFIIAFTSKYQMSVALMMTVCIFFIYQYIEIKDLREELNMLNTKMNAKVVITPTKEQFERNPFLNNLP